MLSRVNTPVFEAILPKRYMVYDIRTTAWNIYLALTICGKGTLVAAAGACSIRLVKYWHLKEKRNLELLKERTEAQLQLLRAQVHPHFLFNTLNNIYSKAQYESPGTGKMIMELSHILRYVLDEGKRELVPLENELQMLQDYINLEKMRYDDRLDLHLSLPSKTEGVYIAPLLLLPFVENCFKHGTSKMLNNPWINLRIELQGSSLFMKVMNGKKPLQNLSNTRKGMGIDNVKKRLELLYKDKYHLQINEEEEVFVVNLTLELIKVKQTNFAAEPIKAIKEYA
jgi:LytS/YehU family sensor histidine kinase